MTERSGRTLLRHLLETEDDMDDAVVVFTNRDGLFLSFSDPLTPDRVEWLLSQALNALRAGLKEETP